VLSLAYLRRFDWRKYTGYLYKLICSVPCPACKINIVREEGCKFMECGKCGYQFCWYCLDEFYTVYHYEVTNCPFRYCLLHSIEVAGFLILLVKLMLTSPFVNDLLLFTIKNLAVHGTLCVQIVYLKSAIKSLKKTERHLARHQESLRGKINITGDQRRRTRQLTNRIGQH